MWGPTKLGTSNWNEEGMNCGSQGEVECDVEKEDNSNITTDMNHGVASFQVDMTLYVIP